MDALRGPDPDRRIDLNNNQPDPVGHAWLRNVRGIRDVLVDIYMPREENGGRRLDWSHAGMTVCAVTAFCVAMYDTCQWLSLHGDSTTDADSKAIMQKARSRLLRGAACSLVAVAILTTNAMGRIILRRQP